MPHADNENKHLSGVHCVDNHVVLARVDAPEFSLSLELACSLAAGIFGQKVYPADNPLLHVSREFRQFLLGAGNEGNPIPHRSKPQLPLYDFPGDRLAAGLLE
jgi:hypothetical protein